MVEVTVRPGPTAAPWEDFAPPGAPAGAPWTTFAKTPEPVVPPVKPVETAEPSGGPWKLFQKAVEPITSYPSTQQRMAHEGIEQAGKGFSDLRPESSGGPKGGTAGALWDVVAGGLKYATSPIEAGLETIVGKPFEENFGIPKEYSALVAGLAIPYYGLRGGAAQTTAKKIFTPESLPGAEPAVTAIRREQGIAARDTATTAQSIEQHYPLVNAMPDAERFDLIRYMEGRSTPGAAPIPPQMQGLADTMRTAFQERAAKIAAMPTHQQMSFVQDYYPHFWQDPAQAAAYVSGGGVGKQGSGASMKARSMPTIEDGIQAGLTPVTTNPLEATMRYVNSMDKFIAQQRVFNEGVANGHIIFEKPKAMGASGHPTSVQNIPDGHVALQGRGAINALGEQAFAPEPYARIYNNFITKGFERFGPEYGAAYTAARRASNTVTALELSLSGYHAYTMAQEAVINTAARALQQGARGDKIAALWTVLKAPLAPVSLAITGGKVERGALGAGPMTPEMRQIVDILTEGGARFKGREHAADIGNSAAGSFFTAWKRGSLKTEILSDISAAGQASVTGKAGLVAKNVGRTMDTIMQPLFEKYIPKIKNGAAYENMADWLKANPTATHPEQVAAARKIVDSVDNRFGEMIQDNIFWHKFMKESAMVSMRSYSWTMGAIREIGGGMTDTLAGHGFVPGKDFTQRQAYAITLPIVSSLTSATYQYLKTGEPPQSSRDLVYPRTGGTDVTTGEPEVVTPPGFMKDLLGWAQHPRQEAINKMGTAPRLAAEVVMTGKNWRGDPIAPPADVDDPSIPANVPGWLKAYFTHVAEALGPISVKNAIKGPRIGSNLGTAELLTGFQPAGMQKTDPAGFEVMMQRKEFKEWRRKQMHDEAEKNKYPDYKGP